MSALRLQQMKRNGYGTDNGVILLMGAKSGPKDITLEQVITALRETNGNMALSGRRLGITRQAIQHYVNTYATAKQAHDEAAAYVSDIAEGHLVNAVMKGNLDQVKYWLENKARDRGYGRAPQTNGLETLNITPEQLADYTDEQLDNLIVKLDKLTRSR